MRFGFRVAAALLYFAFTSVAEAAAGPASGADAEAIRSIGITWKQLYAAGNYAAIPELYTEDTMVMPRGRPRIVGREQLRRSMGGLAAGRKVDIDVVERELIIDGDVAWFVGDFTVTYSPREGAGPSTTEYGRSLLLFMRGEDGRWRIHRDMDSPAPAPASVAKPPPVWDPKSRTEATECDRLASGRYDRHRLAKPVARAEIDVPAAIRQCEADLARLPGDARLHFHLGRLYGYAGDVAKTRMHREAAAAAGDPNAIFLLGYLDFTAAKDDRERCRAAEQMRLAADRGNYSAQLAYPAFALEGRFAACGNTATREQLAAYAAAARAEVDGFFETLFAEHLIREARSP